MTITLLVLTAVVHVVSFGVSVTAHGLYSRWASAPMSVTGGQLERLDLAVIAVDLFRLALVAGTAAAFMAWLWRACSNLEPFGVHDLRFGRGWAIGSWFVPLASFVIPKLVVDDTWRASSPSTAAPMPWRQRRAPVLFHAWWALFVLWNLGYLVADGVMGAATEPAVFRNAAVAAAGADAAGAVGAVLAIGVVVAISRRQEERMRLRPAPVAAALRAPVLVGGLMPLLMVGAVLGRVLVPGEAGPTTSLAIRDGSGTVVAAGAARFDELREGDCFEATPGLWWGGPDVLLAVRVVPCDEPHDHVVMAAIDLAGGPLAPYPGDDQILWEADDLCLEVFDDYAHGRRDVDRLDVYYFYPTRETWAGGDREVVCVLGHVDSQGLHVPRDA